MQTKVQGERYSCLEEKSGAVNRRAVLAGVPVVGLAGCLERLGLSEAVVVLEKSLEATEVDFETGEQRDLVLARRRDAPDGPVYEELADHRALESLDADSPLVVDDTLQAALDEAFFEIRLRAQVCDHAPVGDPEAAEGCHDVSVVRSDFNEIRVGDEIEVRSSDDGIGLLEVRRRREER